MAKTPSYVLELELQVELYQQHLLEKYLNTARVVYNTCLSIALTRSNLLKSDKEYRALIGEKSSKERNERLKEIRLAYGFSEYQIHDYVVQPKHHYAGHLGINEAQKLATRAFDAVEKLHFGKANKVNFKSIYDSVSVENKSNKTGLREKNGRIIWNKLSLSYTVKKADKCAQLAMLDKTKYVRILKKTIRGTVRYFVQLIKEGIPPNKKRTLGKGKVGIDIGTSTIAVVSDAELFFQKIIENLQTKSNHLRLIQRKMDRSKRQTNPSNFNENGTIKKGKKKWNFSHRYQKLRAEYQEIQRIIRMMRKESHEHLANRILSLGDDIKVETMHFNGLQKRAKETKKNKQNGKNTKKKRFGKSLLNYAPSFLLTIIDRKLKYHGLLLKKIDTFSVRASQYNHLLQTYKKKNLSERWNDFGSLLIHRDLYSAFLIKHVKDDLKTIDQISCEIEFNDFVQKHHLFLSK